VESKSDGSVILFYSFATPEQPQLFRKKAWIERPHSKAGAVAMCKLSGGHFLLLVLGKHFDKKLFLDSYLSVSTDIGDGFVRTGSYDAAASGFPDCQGMDILVEKNGNMYIAATGNVIITAPVVNDKDILQLFRLELDSVTKSVKSLKSISHWHFITKVKGRGVSKDSPYQANFNAGASLYVHPSGALFLYSCAHYRRKEILSVPFEEFYPYPDRFEPKVIRRLTDAWIEFYEHDNFEGRRLSLKGSRDAEIPDYSRLVVQGKGFNGEASSVRYQIPSGKRLRLYRKKNYKSKESDCLDLVGSGKLKLISDLKKSGFGDKLKSSRFV
ncbi:MAG: hypothetical protein P1R58_11315, partial [bacterium]|nr:hypothetical protein [bacterium]